MSEVSDGCAMAVSGMRCVWLARLESERQRTESQALKRGRLRRCGSNTLCGSRSPDRLPRQAPITHSSQDAIRRASALMPALLFSRFQA